jgi:hypothetical protein
MGVPNVSNAASISANRLSATGLEESLARIFGLFALTDGSRHLAEFRRCPLS